MLSSKPERLVDPSKLSPEAYEHACEQTKENIIGRLGQYNVSVDEADVIEIRFDRILVVHSDALEKAVCGAGKKWRFMIGRHRPWGDKTAIRGWRIKVGRFSPQAVLHKVGGVLVFEFDIDPNNPAKRLFGHIRNWFEERSGTGRKFNPHWVASQLNDRCNSGVRIVEYQAV